MATTITPAPGFHRRLLFLAIASATVLPLITSARAAEQEWNCRAVKGQWQCQPQPRRAGAAAPPQLAAGAAAAIGQRNEWDWMPKAQLADPGQCDTGCEGAYVAPEPDWPDATQVPDHAALRASAERSRLQNNVVTLGGDVRVSQGNRQLRADQASLDRNSQTLIAEGNIAFREPNLLVTAEATTLNLQSTLGEFERARFLQHDKSLRGSAQTIARDTENQLRLEEAMVTHCPPDDETWKLEASQIKLDNETGWGSARHARLNIADVPIVYVPYMTFPIDDRRKSGFLWPSFGSSSSGGLELTAPWYFNIAPNYDATLAPRYIENRGTMPQLEMRYLNPYGEWLVGGAWLEDDLYRTDATAAEIEDEDLPVREKRWVGNIDHEGWAGPIGTRIDYTRVSDRDFFKHLNTDSLELKRSAHVLQEAALTFSANDWQSELFARRYQTLDEDLDKQYELLPRFSLEHRPGGANFAPEWLLATEYSDFDHDQSYENGGSFTTGQRVYAEAGASFPMRGAGAFVIPTAKLRSIRYDLDADAAGEQQTRSTASGLGSLDMGLIFERQGKSYRQTLEPRLYYLYSDYDAQSAHPNFDSRELTFSYEQLFRETRFTGHDRLDDNNQLSAGVSSRLIDRQQGNEWLTLSLGQIFYFEDRRVQLDQPLVPERDANSQIAAEVLYQPAATLWLRTTVLWDSREDRVDETGVSIHYQTAGSSLYNLGYRFRREGVMTVNNQVSDLSQLDASTVLPLSARWNLYARYRYDTEQHRAIDNLAGLRYEDCCWAVSLLYQRSLKDEYIDTTNGDVVIEHENAFVLEFQLKGLGNLGNQAWDMLRENILGYEDFAD